MSLCVTIHWATYRVLRLEDVLLRYVLIVCSFAITTVGPMKDKQLTLAKSFLFGGTNTALTMWKLLMTKQVLNWKGKYLAESVLTLGLTT